MLDPTAGRDIEQANAEAAAMKSFEIGKAGSNGVEIGLRASHQARRGRSGEKAAYEKSTARNQG